LVTPLRIPYGTPFQSCSQKPYHINGLIVYTLTPNHASYHTDPAIAMRWKKKKAQVSLGLSIRDSSLGNARDRADRLRHPTQRRWRFTSVIHRRANRGRPECRACRAKKAPPGAGRREGLGSGKTVCRDCRTSPACSPYHGAVPIRDHATARGADKAKKEGAPGVPERPKRRKLPNAECRQKRIRTNYIPVMCQDFPPPRSPAVRRDRGGATRFDRERGDSPHLPGLGHTRAGNPIA
jgi:hypothetical protein